MAQAKKDEKNAHVLDAGDAVIGTAAVTEQGYSQMNASDQDEEQGDPLYMVAHEIYRVSRDGKRSAAQLRKVIVDVYPQTSKEESMRFLASMTRMLQAAEVAQRMAKEIHDSVLNKAW